MTVTLYLSLAVVMCVSDGDNTLLKCYDCDSISEPSCGNPDDGDFRLYTHQAVYCPDGIVYCRTDEYFYNGEIEILVPLDMKGSICHFIKWQIHPFISCVTSIQVY